MAHSLCWDEQILQNQMKISVVFLPFCHHKSHTAAAINNRINIFDHCLVYITQG